MKGKLTRGRCTDVNGRKNREKIKKGCTMTSWKAGGYRKVFRTQEMWQMAIKGRTLSITKGVSAVPRNS